MREQSQPLEHPGVGGGEVLRRVVAGGRVAHLLLGETGRLGHPRKPDPAGVGEQHRDELAEPGATARDRAAAMLELVEESDVVVRLDHERRDLDQRQHAVDDAGHGGLLDALLAGRLADDPAAVE